MSRTDMRHSFVARRVRAKLAATSWFDPRKKPDIRSGRGSISLSIRRMIVADWDEYVSYAEHCLSIARTLANREARIILREMAAEWTNLAQSLDSPQATERPAE